ncbi:MAG: thiamine ABC transporter substrate binding subunit [Inquilinus sp.]|nr:thiamine ABC transporter substrate binding subunit [Inquilinus sp.]
MRRFIQAFLVVSSAVLAPAAAAAETLTVYTYNSFFSEWGPGPVVERAFEAECGCDLEFVGVDDGVAILSRLRLEGARTRADVVLGLDMNLVSEAAATGLLAPHGLDLSAVDPMVGSAMATSLVGEIFVPYDWGYFAFVYDSESLPTPPESLRALVEDSEVEILIQDPRTSTPGLGLLLWMRQVFGAEAADAWEKLRPRIVTVTSGWSEAYGLFLEGEAPMVLSYTTSPAYHLTVDGEDRYRAAPFEEGHYVQIEGAAKTATTDQPDLADRFLAFILTPPFQGAIPTTNWMYPAVAPEDGLPPAFDSLIEPSRMLLPAPVAIPDKRGAWVEEWLAAMSR